MKDFWEKSGEDSTVLSDYPASQRAQQFSVCPERRHHIVITERLSLAATASTIWYSGGDLTLKRILMMRYIRIRDRGVGCSHVRLWRGSRKSENQNAKEIRLVYTSRISLARVYRSRQIELGGDKPTRLTISGNARS